MGTRATRKEYIYNAQYEHVPRDANHVIVQVYCRSIGWRAFDGCIYLQRISFSALDDLQIIHALAFWGCTSLQTIPIPTSVNRIDEGAFEKCTALRHVHLPDGLQHIAESTFYACTSLEFIEIPPKVKKIGKFAFAYCTALREVKFPSAAVDNGRLRVIGSCAFMKCTSLTKATIPSTVISIGQSAFENCTRLQEVVMEDDDGIKGTTTTSMNIHLRAFQNCVRLYLVKLPKALRVMNRTAFNNCENLIQLDFPPSFQLKAFQNGWPLIKTVLVAAVQTYSIHWDSLLREQLKQVCARGKSAFRKQLVHALAKQMRLCRRIEITSLLELALWNKAIEEEVEIAQEGREEDMMIDRAKCRITCGAHVVMQNVLGYFDPSSSAPPSTTSCSIRPLNVPEL